MNQNRAVLIGFLRRPRAVIARLCLALAAAALPVSGHPGGYWPAPVAAPVAAGHSYFVNSTLDTPAANPAQDVCADANGRCTLRAAIMRTNFVAGPNTITVPSGVYLLTRAGFDDAELVGDLDISTTLAIQGAGSGTTIVDGNGAVTHNRVFEILANAGNVSLSGLTIRNGQAPTATEPTLNGGGIYRTGGSGPPPLPGLHLTGVVIEGNTARNGGGLFADGGQVELDNTSFRANAATNSGGGLFADGSLLTVRDSQVYSNTAITGGGLDAGAAQVELDNTSLHTNVATASGGGLYASGSYLTVRDSQVYSNTAFTGGGLLLYGISDGHIDRTEIYSNTASTRGGGIYNDFSSRVTLLDSYLHNNHANVNGGAIDNYSSVVISHTVLDANSAGEYGGGLMINNTGVPSAMLINRSTLSRNTAQFGGGINFTDQLGAQSTLAVVNSTLSGNTATHEGGGIYAIYFAHITLDNATIAGNQLDPPMIHPYLVVGGGLFIATTAIITAQNTIIADNYLSHGIMPATPDDCFGPLVSLDYNLIGYLMNCSLSGTTTNNVTGKNPLLGPLGGAGSTPGTMDPLPGSPAIDAGNPNGCRDDQGQLLSTDERGFRRPIGPNCDIGAVEWSPFALVLPLITR